MKELIAGFSGQMQKAREIGQAAKFTAPAKEIRNVVLIGMGGSAFGGELTRNFIQESCPVPFDIVRDYTVPGYVSEHTLLIVSSYSGNTEETLSALNSALPKNPKVAVITSGGKALEMAQSNGWDHVVVPGGNPPRSAAGYSVIQQLYVLKGFALIADFEAALEEAIELVRTFEDEDHARLIAEQIHGRIPVLYSSPALESACIRWRQQIEENSKHIAFHHVIPEMNHNELVGWKNPKDLLEDSTVIVLRSSFDHPRTGIRMDICRDIFGDFADGVIEVYATGDTHLAQLFYLLHLGDWVSWHLSQLNEEDAMPVDSIDFLKSELAKHK